MADVRQGEAATTAGPSNDVTVDVEAGNVVSNTPPPPDAAVPPKDAESGNASDTQSHVARCDTMYTKEVPSSEDLPDKGGDAAPAKRRSRLQWAMWALIAVAVAAYSIAAFIMDFRRALPLLYIELCALVIGGWVAASRTAPYKLLAAKLKGIAEKVVQRISSDRKLTVLAAIITLSVVGLIIGLSIDDARRLVSLLGLTIFVFGSWACSWNRHAVRWRPVIGGLLFQFFFGVLILRTQIGFVAFNFLGTKMKQLIDHTNEGSSFVFGWAATGFNSYAFNPAGGVSDGVVKANFGAFAFAILPTVIFFSALVSVLYYLGVLQAVIRVIGAVLCTLLGTSVSESLNAAGNIFVGQTEAPLLIKPFIVSMTPSELHAVMTGGFATIAGGVLAVYISFGVDPSHLLAASVMSAPAALAVSKLLYPEDEESKTRFGVEYEIPTGDEGNVIEAAANGAAMAIQLAINIGGQLIAFLSIIHMLNAWLSGIGSLVNLPQLSFELICGYIFFPVAFIMGVPLKDCTRIAELLGKKIFVNEFVAYTDLQGPLDKVLDERSKAIAVFALCGFSNFGSIGVQLGGLVPLAPNQSKQLARLVFSAMIAGNIACFMTACIAGVLVK